DLLPDQLTGRSASIPMLENRGDASLFDVMEECERHIINDMLEKCAWNQTEAAERFHIPLSTLNQKIKRLNIEIKNKSSAQYCKSTRNLSLISKSSRSSAIIPFQANGTDFAHG